MSIDAAACAFGDMAHEAVYADLICSGGIKPRPKSVSALMGIVAQVVCIHELLKAVFKLLVCHLLSLDLEEVSALGCLHMIFDNIHNSGMDRHDAVFAGFCFDATCDIPVVGINIGELDIAKLSCPKS